MKPSWRFLLFLFLSLSLACSLLTPTPAALPTPTAFPTPAEPLPPVVVEVQPPPGSQIPLQTTITIYFNQAMDTISVENSLKGINASFTWEDNATLILTPRNSLSPLESLELSLGTGTRAANGLGMQNEFIWQYTTSDFLRVSEMLPLPDTENATPTSAIVVTFNQPVVPLGVQTQGLPPAFSLDPPAIGTAEWLNTSTYIFYPDKALNGGTRYSILLNPELKSLSGSPLATDTTQWTFTTSLPELVAIEPATPLLALDAPIELIFNQPMDIASVEQYFSLQGASGKVVGKFSWQENDRRMRFTPDSLLDRDTQYTIRLEKQAAGRGGTPLASGAQFKSTTYPDFAVDFSYPSQGEMIRDRAPLVLTFTSPPNIEKSFVSFSPEVGYFSIYNTNLEFKIWAAFLADTTYTIRIASSAKDQWGQSLQAPYTLTFKTPPATPEVNMPYVGSRLIFANASNPLFRIQAVNVSYVDTGIGVIPLGDLFDLLGPNGYQRQENYSPPGGVNTWRQPINLPVNRMDIAPLQLSPTGNALTPGIYYFYVRPPAGTTNLYRGWGDAYLIASNINLTFKIGAADALVWATDMRNNAPVSGKTVSIYDENAILLASGETDQNGIWHSEIPIQDNPYRPYYAVLGEPGEDTFGFSISQWGYDISPWKFNIDSNISPPTTKVYLYTERPIYRPGQTVYFKAIIREGFDGRYSLPDLTTLELKITDSNGRTIKNYTLPISGFGTAHSEFEIPENALPGHYSIQANDTNSDIHFHTSFQVAEYRKPEIDFQSQFSQTEILAAETISTELSAKYFFGAPSADLPVTWNLYSKDAWFDLPGYQVGTSFAYWFEWDAAFGKFIESGETRTDAQGQAILDFAELPVSEQTQELTLEATIRDESGQTISTRTSTLIHPADYYIGLKSDLWIAQSQTPIGFEVYTVDWNKKTSPSRSLLAAFSRVNWEKQTDAEGIRWVPVFEPVSSSNLLTANDGKARLSFTPPTPGTYVLDVSGGGARSQIMVWVSGQDRASWPNLSGGRLLLSSGQDEYQAGDVAEIFIPNSFGSETTALVTIERGTIHHAETIRVPAGGVTYSLLLTEDDTPNIFMAVTLPGQAQFQYGLLNINVTPQAQTLNVEIISSSEKAQPGAQVTVKLKVTDSQGKPVQGEFSISLVDRALLALADPNVPDILPAFYDTQPLGITTGISLAGDSSRAIYFANGRGGGSGDGDALTVTTRTQFPDTAYWNPSIVTDSQGIAQVTVTLPDNLTTWRLEARGLTHDTRVGQAESNIVTSKLLLVHPVTPRFAVIGDRIQLAAIVHNNSNNDLSVDVSLQPRGFLLDDSKLITQTVNIVAGGRQRIEWWGTVQDVEELDLLFGAKAGELNDLTFPNMGAIPVLQFTARQSFVTAGILPDPGMRLEVISLPRSFIPSGGGLTIELSPSLAAVLIDGLDSLEPPGMHASNVDLIAYILPHLSAKNALQQAGLEVPEIEARLKTHTITVIQQLQARKLSIGGWGWHQRGSTDRFTTAYILLGLQRMREAGYDVPNYLIEDTRQYLGSIIAEDVYDQAETWELDRASFIAYVLQESGGIGTVIPSALLEYAPRLSPWGQAFLALTLESTNPGNPETQRLLSDLAGTAIRSASGANWQSDRRHWNIPGTPLFTTSVVVYSLTQRDPASPVLADAVRYLAAHRDVSGWWHTAYQTSWVLMALAEFMQGTGEFGADYTFDARLNGIQSIQGRAAGANTLTTITTRLPLSNLSATTPNALTINRSDGAGRLYYRAALEVYQPVEAVTPITKGISITRQYVSNQCTQECDPITMVGLSEDARLKARLTLTLPNDVYYLMVEDFIPAGAEILNLSLKTSQQGEEAQGIDFYDPEHPFVRGWGWWWFNTPQIFDERIIWSVEYLPAGTYELTYTLIPQQAGQFKVLPAHAWLMYFPDVQGTSAGTIFEISP